MSLSPLVSVIMPTYNAAQFIDEALASILCQTYKNVEIIVVDDGSTDGTAQIVARYSGVRYLYQLNSGGFPGSPRNMGIRQSTGAYIAFLDADDVMLPDRLQAQVELLTHHCDVGLIFSNYRNFSANGPAEQSHFETCPLLMELLKQKEGLILESEEATALLVRENIGVPSSLMIRREILRDAPFFSTEMQIGEDFHFYYRAARKWKLGLVNSIGSLRRLHGNNITGDALRMMHSFVVSRTALRDTETNATNLKYLNECLFRGEINLARAYADRRDFARALMHNWQAIREDFPKSISQQLLGLRTFARTLVMACGLKKPLS